ncbi:MAG: hypothetical protein IPN94_06590 [Sphingobacteriales bacterium]|jgi:hypothetical protein|nr:hypothetical protein [Sphingobacteriales bacterium]
MKTFFRFLFLCVSFMALNTVVFAQRSTQTKPPEKTSGFDKSRLQLGGDLGLSFGNQAGMVVVSPLVGYMITNRFSAGAGPSFEHYWQKDVFKLTTLGGRVYSRYQLFDFLFAHAEYGIVNYKTSFAGGSSQNAWVSRLPLGGGISQRIGGNTFANFMVLYDVLYNPDSPYNFGNSYNGLILRGGITLGL